MAFKCSISITCLHKKSKFEQCFAVSQQLYTVEEELVLQQIIYT